jgi:protein-S-isoprenylcysteine O-methyltransferase Ste14
MDATWARWLLTANLLAHAALLAGAVWCIAFPARRIYPMARPDAWYFAMWTLFGFIFVSNPLFVLLDWNAGPWSGPLRFWLAGPLVLLGGGLVLWGMATLGARRTSGLPEGLVAEGPYLLTRNPQYVGDLLLFTGIAVLANSDVVLVTHLLTALVLLVAPFAEEPWLEGQYGDAYVAYRQRVPRYL